MSLKEFDILLLNPEKENCYKAGGTLQGKIVLVYGGGKKYNIRKLKISFVGKARNHWQEENQDGELIDTEFEEQYLNFDADIAIDEEHLLVNQEKKTEYGFEYELAKGLPSSYEGTYGSIVYQVIAVIEGSCCHTVTKEFTVKGIVDLNEFQELGQPSNVKSRQELLFGEGYLGMEGTLQKVGFVSGESVILDFKLSNDSNKDVQVNLYLLKETCYYARDRKVSDITVITYLQGPKIKPSCFEFWKGPILQVPELPLSSSNGCSIIDIQYRIVIEMEIPGRNINLEATIPIVIGSIPIDIAPILESGKPTNFVDNLSPEEKELLNKDPPSKKIKPRQSRHRTTCLVFRPARPKLKLPTPNPESWPRPKKEEVMVANSSHIFMEEDINPDELIRHVEELVPHIQPNVQGGDWSKPKWPAAFVRRRKKSPQPILGAENSKTENTMQKYSENDLKQKRKDLPIFPGYTKKSENVGPHEGSENVVSKPATQPKILPYPLAEHGLKFPVPDFSFNIQENGKCQREIGWNVTRNTLSLRRAKVAAGMCLPLPTVGWSADP